MKYKIYTDISKTKIKKFVPQRYLTTFPRTWPEKCTIIVFKRGRDDYIPSTIVDHAIRSGKLDGKEKIIAFGGSFTVESIELLNSKGISYISLSNFPFKDQDIIEINNYI